MQRRLQPRAHLHLQKRRNRAFDRPFDWRGRCGLRVDFVVFSCSQFDVFVFLKANYEAIFIF